MTSKRTFLGAAAFSVALAGGGSAGAVLGTPSLTSAQEDTTTTTQAPGGSDAPAAGEAEAGRRHGHGPRGERLATVAEAIGITADELRTELEAGKSIAQVAADRDVDVQTVIDALVAEGRARLEAMLAELPERATELVNREGLPERHGRGGHRSAAQRAEPTGTEADAT
ncbi:MAG: hypothetical protein Q8K58_17060 [Acidimicrobiales bacterium]|nr:hypothetical protein [Acidimicrobiales bacterium]